MEMEKWRAEIAKAQAAGVCAVCHAPVKPNIYSEAGEREYVISGCCEVCFDRMFAERPIADPKGFAEGGTKDTEPLEADDDTPF